MKKILIFDSHPVQYKAPVYQALNELRPGAFEVIYATDVSVRSGHIDREFGKEVVWDTPLLTGYPFRVLNNERGVPLTSPGSLTGKGVFNLVRRERPAAVMLTQARYWFDHTAYLAALIQRIPILIRQETQDEMFAGQRSFAKEWIRKGAYHFLYAPAEHAFAFGKLNFDHLVRHGVSPQRISHARFSVPNPIAQLSDAQKRLARATVRASMEVNEGDIVLGFFGKLIPKKHPEILLESLHHLDEATRRRLHVMYVGAGELQSQVEGLARQVFEQFGVRTSMMGFINQSKLSNYYLAADIVALPSRRMGEAWGLVVNEALNAGCAVLMTDAVGCESEFRQLERVCVIPVGDQIRFAQALNKLSSYERDFNWAEAHMSQYSTEAAARAIDHVFARYV